MHRCKQKSLIFLIIISFQCFFIKNSFSEHLKVQIHAEFKFSQIIIEGYDRKLYFKNKEFPLLIINSPNTSLPISLKAFPHSFIGLFVFDDLNGDKKFNTDYKGNPIEPFGFSLNPNKQFNEISFEDIVFDMSKSDGILNIKLIGP